MEQIVIQAFLIYLLMINLIGYVTMGLDKQKAIKKQYRIPERTLLMIAIAGGGIGSCWGMLAFRHKTKHRKFVTILPITALIYLGVGLKILVFLML